MGKRYALIYSDGCMNVHPDNLDLEKARKMLSHSQDDPDSELVEIEVKVLRRFGPKEVAKPLDHSVTCPTCKTEVAIEQGVE